MTKQEILEKADISRTFLYVHGFLSHSENEKARHRIGKSLDRLRKAAPPKFDAAKDTRRIS